MPWISDFVLRDVPAIPGRLYHYTSQPGLLGILRTKTIWSARIQFLNDSRAVSYTHLDVYKRQIRNWVGQNTEEVFYDLADEYGLLIWNDFWATTQNYNVEPEDPELFLANARDTILRFRNHPSIVVWCGRNEGVPQPVLNKGLAELITSLDGTRYYSPSSNQVNLQNSGPYKYLSLIHILSSSAISATMVCS